MIGRKKVLLASVLKPIDDTRMYEKFASSLVTVADIHILGYEAPQPINAPDRIFFYPYYHFEQGIGRSSAGKKLLHLVKELQPDWLIVHAVELLPVALWCRWRYKTRLVYDIRENYAQNFWYQRVYSPWRRLALAMAVRTVEWMARSFINHFILAEKSYASELGFLRRGAYTVLENKCVLPAEVADQQRLFPAKLPVSTWKILYTGTITELYGIKEAIAWCASLVYYQPIEVTVIGYAHDPTLAVWLREQEAKYSWLGLIGIEKLVPHREILAQIATADIALLPYRANRSTEKCIPTKMYEYMAHGLPMLLPENPLWKKLAIPYQAGFCVDFSQSVSKKLAQKLADSLFYPEGAVAEAQWGREGELLRGLLGFDGDEENGGLTER